MRRPTTRESSFIPKEKSKSAESATGSPSSIWRIPEFHSNTARRQVSFPPVSIPMPDRTTANTTDADGQTNFRFFDNRQKYLMFVNTCSEKWVVANRVAM